MKTVAAALVTFVQRFGSALNLNPHSHALIIDGVYVDGEAGPEFVPAPPLSDDDVQQIVETTAQRVVRLLQRRGLLEEGNTDPLMEQEPLLATITAASIQGRWPPASVPASPCVPSADADPGTLSAYPSFIAPRYTQKNGPQRPRKASKALD